MGTYTQRTKDVSQWTDRIENHGSTSQGRFGASQLITTLEAITEAQDNIDALDAAVTDGLTPDMDSIPTAGSQKPVTSAGIKAAIDTAVSGRQPLLTFDSTPTASSTNPVTSGGVYAALQNVQPQITIDPTPTMASPNPVSSGGVYAALQGVGGGNMQIVTEGSATTISPIADKYYVLTYDVETLTVNLPNLAAESSIKGFVLFFHVGTYQSITINPAASGQNVYYYDGFEFADDTTYEMNFVWNGSGWIVAYGIVSGYANS